MGDRSRDDLYNRPDEAVQWAVLLIWLLEAILTL
jgi:hypothetical protein